MWEGENGRFNAKDLFSWFKLVKTKALASQKGFVKNVQLNQNVNLIVKNELVKATTKSKKEKDNFTLDDYINS